MFGSDLQRNRSPFCMAWALLAWLPLGSCSLRHRLAFCLIDEEAAGVWGKRGSGEVGTKFLTAVSHTRERLVLYRKGNKILLSILGRKCLGHVHPFDHTFTKKYCTPGP